MTFCWQLWIGMRSKRGLPIAKRNCLDLFGTLSQNLIGLDSFEGSISKTCLYRFWRFLELPWFWDTLNLRQTCLRQPTVVMSTVLTWDASTRRHLSLRCEACSKKYRSCKNTRAFHLTTSMIDSDWSCNFMQFLLVISFVSIQKPFGAWRSNPVHGVVKAPGFAKAQSW